MSKSFAFQTQTVSLPVMISRETENFTEKKTVEDLHTKRNSSCGTPRMQKLRSPLRGAQGYQRFPISKLGVGQKIAFHATLVDRTSSDLPSSAFPVHSTSFFPKTSPVINSAICHKQWIINWLLIAIFIYVFNFYGKNGSPYTAAARAALPSLTSAC